MAMHDVEKTTLRSGYKNAKRMRRRKRLMPMYIAAVLVLTVCLGIALSMTFFFNVASIEVYCQTPEDMPATIVHTGGVKKGDNLLKMDVEKVSSRIESEMVNIETADVSKKYPDTLIIEVKACRESFNVYYDNGILLTSESGKIIENTAETYGNLPVIYGMNPTVLSPGKKVASADKIKNKVFDDLAEIMNRELNVPITSIDMSDKYNIKVVFDKRIEFSMGNWNEISYKITLAEAVIARLGKDKEGYLTMIGNNQCAFRDKASVELANQIAAGTTTTASSDPDSTGEPASSTTTTTVTVAQAAGDDN